MISVHFQGKPFNITVLQVYAPTTNPKEDVGPHGTIQRWLLQDYWSGHSLGLPYIEWFALEMNRVHSVVFQTASKYCISDSFFDYDGHSIFSKGFLPAVVDIMVI